MDIKINNNEFESLVSVEINTIKLAELLRKKVGEELAQAIRSHTNSYVSADMILGSNCSISIVNNNISVVLNEDLKIHGSEDVESKEFLVSNPKLLYLLYSVYYMGLVDKYPDVTEVTLGKGWGEKEKEAE